MGYFYVATALLALAALGALRPERGCMPPLLALAGGDSDMKIVPDFPQRRRSEQADSGEAGAEQFLKNRDCGNIDRARELGGALAREILKADRELLSQSGGVLPQGKVLFAYIVSHVMAEQAPNTIVYYAALQEFYNTVTDKSPQLAAAIQDSGVMSLYILAGNSPFDPWVEMGRVFAKLCGSEGDAAAIELGTHTAQRYAALVRTAVADAQFVDVD